MIFLLPMGDFIEVLITKFLNEKGLENLACVYSIGRQLDQPAQ